MIAATDKFKAEIAKEAQKPAVIVEIEGYKRTFSTMPGMNCLQRWIVNSGYFWAHTTSGVKTVQLGVYSGPGNVGTGKAYKPGNILIAFLSRTIANISGSPSIADTNSNSWTALHANGTDGTAMWWATANSNTAVPTFQFTPGTSGLTFFNCVVLEIDIGAGSFTYGFGKGTSTTPSATTSGSFTQAFTLQANEYWEEHLFDFNLSGAPWHFAIINTGSGLSYSTTAGITTRTNMPANWMDATTVYCPLTGASPGFNLVAYGTVTDWISNIDPLSLTVDDLNGTSNLSDFSFEIVDLSGGFTADLGAISAQGRALEGKRVYVFVGSQNFTTRGDYDDYFPIVSDWTQYFKGVINTIDTDSGNVVYKITCSSFNLKKLSQKIFTVGDDGQPISSNNPKTITGHPLDILVTALNAAGVDTYDIDTVKLNYFKNTLQSGWRFEFDLTSAPTAKDFIENEIMRPLGMYIWENSNGLVSVNAFYYPRGGDGTYVPPSYPAATLTVDNTTDVPTSAESALVNQMEWRFDMTDSSSDPGATLTTSWLESTNKYGLLDAQTIESKGLKSKFQGFVIAKYMSRLVFIRYGMKALLLDVPCFWSLSLQEPGDVVSFTEAYVPDREAGVIGISGKFFEILNRTWDFMAGTVTFTLLQVSSRYNFNAPAILITPNAEAVYTSASSGDKAKYMFLAGDNDLYSNSDPANKLV